MQALGKGTKTLVVRGERGKGTGTQGGPMAGGSTIAVFSLIQRDGEARSQGIPDVKGQDPPRHHPEQRGGRSPHYGGPDVLSYRGLEKKFASHVDHSHGEYVRGEVHTANIDSFWSLIKRGIMGSFHHVSKTYLPLYLNEFSFRHNNRKNDDIFSAVVAGS